ncbi:late embryogenis abundant protein 2-like [Bidens hawaiensis]|uniref:late embryogenis abundant protein 2-like n=1 Tax=Bidens hawaiensis TaxID=980011 RepID=UPI00404987CB
MASAKLISISFIVDQLSFVAARRGFATASQGIVSRGSGVAMMKKVASDESNKSTPWVPDPVTGYYRPEGQTNEIDAAELRQMLLKQKNRRN